MKTLIHRQDLVEPELSYEIVGACFDVFNEFGSGHPEKVYQKALEIAFEERKLKFEKQKYSPLIFKTIKVGSFFYDFVIENKIVVEIKVDKKFKVNDYKQLKTYLVDSKLPLGILVRFSEDGVTFCRILPPNS
ncbi:MAG: GxxExxY protein [Candidatus Uhrbacteria bacterium]